MTQVAQLTYTADEMMAVAAARRLRDGTVCFVGIGLPSQAANLARATHAPNCVLVYESGTIGDFLTTPGRPRGSGGGAGVTCVITDLGVLEPDADGEVVLTELHPGVTVARAKEATGWELRVAPQLRPGRPPDGDELRALRSLRPANEDTVG
jgi:acyl CoA:acetate/3-ketoacid CoA transferase beta subunit